MASNQSKEGGEAFHPALVPLRGQGETTLGKDEFIYRPHGEETPEGDAVMGQYDGLLGQFPEGTIIKSRSEEPKVVQGLNGETGELVIFARVSVAKPKRRGFGESIVDGYIPLNSLTVPDNS